MQALVARKPKNIVLSQLETAKNTTNTVNSGLGTGLYYYGARYLDPRTSRWISADPAMGEYVPSPGQDPSKLGGMGGVFNTINLHCFHYAGNNPVKLIDPDGRKFDWVQGDGVTGEQMGRIQTEASILMRKNTEFGRRLKELNDSQDVLVTIIVITRGRTYCDADNWDNATNGVGSDSIVFISMEDVFKEGFGDIRNGIGVLLAHDVSGHAYNNYKGTSPYNNNLPTPSGRFRAEQNAIAMENEYRSYKGFPQRQTYGDFWDMPVYAKGENKWYVKHGNVYGNVYDIGMYQRYQRFSNTFIEWKPK